MNILLASMPLWFGLGVSIVLVGIVAWIAWPRPVFVVAVADGEATLVRGRAPAEFVEDCGHIGRDAGLGAFEVRGYGGRESIRLRFSAGVPAELHQRFRNAWGVHAARSF